MAGGEKVIRSGRVASEKNRVAEVEGAFRPPRTTKKEINLKKKKGGREIGIIC